MTDNSAERLRADHGAGDDDPQLGQAITERLVSDLVSDLASKLGAVIVPFADVARSALRTRLLLRVRADAAGSASTTIRGADDQWRPLLPKVAIKILRRDQDTASYLLRLEPGARLPAHPHPVDEECVVLEGEVSIGDLTIRAGDFHHSHRDSRHGVLRTAHGATIYLRGSVQTIGAHH